MTLCAPATALKSFNNGKFNGTDINSLWRIKTLTEAALPYREGKLADNAVIEPWQIEYTVPYARAQYYGHFHHRLDQHPKAAQEWDKRAEPTQKPKLILSLQAYINSGRLNLNG